MKVTIKKPDGTVVFHRELDEAKTLNNVVGFFTSDEVKQGNELLTTITNKGLDLNFQTASYDTSIVVRLTEGIIVRRKVTKEEPAQS